MLPGQIETHFCSSPIPEDLFDSPQGMTSDVPFASEVPYYNYDRDTPMNTPMNTPVNTHLAYNEQQMWEKPYTEGLMLNYNQPSTPVQQEQVVKKKYSFYMEVRCLLSQYVIYG